ncbi:DNA-directed RNA polymerase sigma-70 factor [Haloferula helveola]|uniref:DNA-directed RNA polymerase sigma-70 factor n=1 Tax=Haloferula helveola TaxID=490095 RepID=A0ABM7RIN2_9BACT|nr:DNA-directed RNA polymerase sigma-70 factor [Haloferula helveola]
MFETEKARDAEFVQLLIKHQLQLRAFVLSMMKGSPDVDDIAQDVNALIWERREGFECGTNFRAWMFSVARFRLLAHWRDQKRRREWVFSEEVWESLAAEAEEHLAVTDERHVILRQCIRNLRPADRGLVLNRYLGEDTLRELSARTGRPEGSLKVSLHRIRGLLRTCISRKLNPVPDTP